MERFSPQLLTAALPLYDVPLSVESWESEFSVPPRDTPEMVEFWSMVFVTEPAGRETVDVAVIEPTVRLPMLDDDVMVGK